MGFFGIIILLVAALIFLEPTMRIWWFPIAMWIGITAYSLRQLRSRVTLFTFLVTFGFFLLSKPIVMGYFDYDGIGWSSGMQDHLVLVLSLGLAALYCGYRLLPKKMIVGQRVAKALDTEWWALFAQRLANASLIAFMASLPFSIVHLVTRIRTAGEFGYTGLYVGGGGAFASLAAYGNVANTVALCLFLAAIPSRRTTWLVLLLATTPRALLMITGDRADFGTYLLLVFVYLVIRTRDGRHQLMSPRLLLVASLVAAAIVLPLFIIVGLERGVGAGHTTLISFLYGQGASLNVIEYGKEYADRIPEGNYMLLFADQGFFRFLFGGEGGLAGNSVQYALSGTSFSHSLSYTVLGDFYLTGRGVGTSYLAEAYADWGYVGVAVVGFGYGMLVAWIDRFPPTSIVFNALRLVIVPSVLFAPRGSATGFLADLLSPVTLIVLLGVWLLARAVTSNLRKQRGQARLRRPPS